jgi:hypothetical protein
VSTGGERRLRILAQLVGSGAPELDSERLCEVCADATGMSGAGIMLMSGDVPRGSVGSTDEVSAAIEELQFDLGEGPCVDAYQQDQPVLEPDLADPATPRWVGFTGPAVEAGARAIFGFPLQVGAVRLGALNLYCSQPGPLTDDQHADALVMADVAAQALLVMQSNAPPGKLAAELEAGSDFQYVVHQASGKREDEKVLAVAGLDDLDQKLIRAIRGHAPGPIRGVAFRPDGRQLVTSSWDRTVRVWDLAGDRGRLKLTGHTEPVNGVAYAPDGRWFASASYDQSVRIWDAENGTERSHPLLHSGGVLGVAVSPDGL